MIELAIAQNLIKMIQKNDIRSLTENKLVA